MSIKYKIKILCLLTVLSLPSFLSALASNNYFKEDTTLPSIKEFKHSNILKTKVAKKLRKWTIEVLEKSGTVAAVISRPGTRSVRMLDKTGMGHTGIVLWDSELNQWMVYNLFSDPSTRHRYFEICRTTVYDFFYSQPSLKLNALILMPEQKVQENIVSGFISGKYKKFSTTKIKYNLISSIENLESVNCVEWITLNIFAARENKYDHNYLIKKINTEISVNSLKPTFLLKRLLDFMPHVFWDELIENKYIKTIMIQDLYNSKLFTEKIFYRI